MKKLVLFMCITFLFVSCEREQAEFDLNKKNSIEHKNLSFKQNNDGFITKSIDNKNEYDILFNTQYFVNKINNNHFRINAIGTNDYIDVVDLKKVDKIYTFNALTSKDEKIFNFKYYGDDLLEQLDKSTNTFSIKNNNQIQNLPCPWCYVIGTIAVAIIEASIDTPLEQCRNAMGALNCPRGSRPYMEFSEGFWTTTCNVGCR